MNTNRRTAFHGIALAAFFATTVFMAGQGGAEDTTPQTNGSASKDDSRKFAYDEETKKTTGPKELVVWDAPTRVTFDHQFHTKEAGLSCESCHDDIFTMKSGSALKAGMSMATMAEGQFCGACHDGSAAFATTTQCASCHYAPEKTIIFNSPVKTVAFDHATHLKKGGLACEACHKEVFKMKTGSIEEDAKAKANDGDKREYLEKLHNKYCGTCHDSSQAFGYLTRCTVCHIGVKGYEALPGHEGPQKKQGDGKKH
jgi:c(7)-type cytochrome triheme protein